MTIRLPMSEKEVAEARRANIPDYIIGKMSQGLELSDKEKEVVRSKGKTYVVGHTKIEGEVWIRPQLRNLPKPKEKFSWTEYYERLEKEPIKISTITGRQFASAIEMGGHRYGRLARTFTNKETVLDVARHYQKEGHRVHIESRDAPVGRGKEYKIFYTSKIERPWYAYE